MLINNNEIIKNFDFLKKVQIDNKKLLIPEVINLDILGIINAIDRKMGINKFLFQGPPGTGKTESAKQIAKSLNRDLYMVDFTILIDSKLGQTGKNIAELFEQINYLSNPEKIVILFDEIDALAMDRINSDDHREIGRATTTILNALDNLNEKIILIATTNLYKYFEKALIRRFDFVIDFSKYTTEELIKSADFIFKLYATKFKITNKNIPLFKKIISLLEPIYYPSEMENLIKTSLAFSDLNNPNDYLKRLYRNVCKDKCNDLERLKNKDFTEEEIQLLTTDNLKKISLKTTKEQTSDNN
ncbi:AAA family ATPase [Mycoplasmopsis citelli]|uniref:AAA family ATPase n=2 Tax=Mycoplasmopsis citelli TaxID=171281 RepID=A0A449B129_9BACT|nr:AAA family ATPase [Mycoplasmopsis citelli]